MPDARRTRALRPPRPAVDPWRPHGVTVEEERGPEGLAPSLTVFLAGAECPFTCVFCDLWRHTTERPTPPGALPRQLDLALAEAGSLPAGAGIKLYNASNFFEPRAVPAEDLPAIADRLGGFARVTVESHPRLLGELCRDFARRLDGRLEVAIGLETAHPEALARLGKGVELADFDRAAEELAAADIELRVFVLVGAPFVPPEEGLEWVVRSARHALERGARIVSLIPLRAGNGAVEELAARGELAVPTLADFEDALDACLDLPGPASGSGVVLADLWDLERLRACPECAPARGERLGRIDRTGRSEPRPACDRCGGGG